MITFWGSFASRETEAEFRHESLAADLRTARFLFAPAAFTALTFLINDRRLLGGTTLFWVVVATRVVMLALTAACYLRFRRTISPAQMDRWLAIWLCVVLFVTLFALSTRPAYLMNHALSVLVIVTTALLVPASFPIQAAASSLFTLGAIGLFLANHPDHFTLLGNLGAFILAVGVGLFSSRKMHRARREYFAARQAERETIGKLEAALCEVRRLQGILPICASCKKIRQEDGGWTALEIYISNRSEARFSHGLCPACLERLYPECSPRLA